jgi:hypothetical protein
MVLRIEFRVLGLLFTIGATYPAKIGDFTEKALVFKKQSNMKQEDKAR